MGTHEQSNSFCHHGGPTFPKGRVSKPGRSAGHWLAVAIVSCPLLTAPAWAENFLVLNSSDQPDADLTDGVCSIQSGVISPDFCTLRAAIQQANALAGADVITLQVPSVTLSIAGSNEDEAATGDLDITDDVEIRGFDNTSPAVIRWEQDIDRVFHVIPEFSTALTRPVVTFDNLSIQGGYLETALGAGIRIDGGVVQILSSEIIDNVAFTSDTPPENPEPDPDTGGIAEVATGGGIYVGRNATVTIEASRISFNTATTAGAGIDNLGNLTLRSNTEITHNNANGTGGGVRNFGGFLNIGQALIAENTASSGGGFYNVTAGLNVGSAVISNATLQANSASQIGAGLYNAGPLTITNSAIAGNSSDFDAGGIFNGALGSIDVINTTISGNRANAKGGGIQNSRVMSLTNVTVFDNQAGIDNDGNPGGNQIYLNDTDGDIVGTAPELILVNTIVANNTQPSDACGGVAGYRDFVNSRGSNIDGGDSCGFAPPGDLINIADPGLDPILNTALPDGVEGEATPYHALTLNSPAVDSGDNGFCPSVDQRFLNRDGSCDIGAYEFGATDFVSGGVVDLKVTIDDSPDPVAPNDAFSQLTYIVTVQNIVDAGTAIDTSLQVQLPASIAVTNINSATGINCLSPDANNLVVCELGNLSGLDRIEIFISGVPSATGIITATASATTLSQDVFPNNNEDSEETEVTPDGSSSSPLGGFGGREGSGGSGAISPWWGLLAFAWRWRRRTAVSHPA